MSTTWHWQERFEATDPLDAYRRQVLKIQKQISHAQWLQEKALSGKLKTKSHIDNNVDDIKNKDSNEEAEKNFREWVKRKRKEKRQQRCQMKSNSLKDDQRRDAKVLEKQSQAYVKPPSLHVNPKIRRKKPSTRSTKQSATKKKPTPDECATVYREWLKRKTLEARVKNQIARVERDKQENAKQLQHITGWQKKLIVCAYSTNQLKRRSILSLADTSKPTHSNELTAA